MSETDGRVPGKRVLIVNDSVDTAKMMSLLLNLEGFETRTAFDGVKALEVAFEFLPEVVLLDLTLPGKTGQEVALELRENNATAGALIIAISGYGDQDAPPGCDRLLVKPVDHRVLRALLDAPAVEHGLPLA